MAIEGEILAGKYRLERLLGSGGFATVWAARNLLIDRLVALKLLSEAQIRQPGMMDRFVREARIAAKELHPTVVRVEDMGQTREGVPFLVMELIEGPTLSNELKQKGSLPVQRSVEVARHVLAGLAAAHAAGIIHRDIKPGNIKLVAPGTSHGPPVRILDLGIAKSTAEGDQITTTDQFIGTPIYLPPEVLLNPGRESWSPAADVFEVGVILFLMLTGRLPVVINQACQGYAQFLQLVDVYKGLLSTGEELSGPADLDPLVPGALDAVVRRSLALRRDERYPDAGAMLAALDDATIAKAAVVRPVPRAVAAPEPEASTAPYPAIPDTQFIPVAGNDPTTTLVWPTLLKGSPSRFKALALGLMVLLFVGVSVGAAVALMTSRDHRRSQPTEPIAALTTSPASPVVQAKALPPVKSEPEHVEAETEHTSPPVKVAPLLQPTPEPAVPVEPTAVKVRLKGVPARSRVLFAGRPIAGEWIEGEPGTRGWLSVQAEGYDLYRRELTLEKNLLIDMSGQLRRVPPPPPAVVGDDNPYEQQPQPSRIKTTLDL